MWVVDVVVGVLWVVVVVEMDGAAGVFVLMLVGGGDGVDYYLVLLLLLSHTVSTAWVCTLDVLQLFPLDSLHNRLSHYTLLVHRNTALNHRSPVDYRLSHHWLSRYYRLSHHWLSHDALHYLLLPLLYLLLLLLLLLLILPLTYSHLCLVVPFVVFTLQFLVQVGHSRESKFMVADAAVVFVHLPLSVVHV